MTAVCIAVVCSVCFAQPLRNEWIDYSKTYYKFQISTNGLYRITQAQLAGLGIGGANAQDFKLWCNGVEVPLYTSVATGALGAGGYIEFYGKANDGKPDADLYIDPTYQPHDKYSLFTDEASYFLTVSPGTNARLANTVNNLVNPGTPQPYCLYDKETAFDEQLWGGNATYIQGEYVRSASFDKGEGFQSDPLTNQSFPLTNLKAYTAGPAMSLYIKGAGAFIGGRADTLELNDSLLATTYNNGFDTYNFTVNGIPLSRISGDATTVRTFTKVGGDIFSSILISYIRLTYPRLFDFDNQTQFSFTLPVNAAGAYLEIMNFNTGGADPVLYDVTNGKRYLCQVSGNTIRVKLQPNAAPASCVLFSSAAIGNTGTFIPRNFINYSTVANQGNYLLIANKILNSGTGNAVQLYRNYRASEAGGGFNAKIIDIDEITDQFAYGIKTHPISIRNFLRFARANFAVAPKFVFLVGHGVNYQEYRQQPNLQNANKDQLNQVPTWGDPGSDNLLSAANNTDPNVLTPIGRISVTNNNELQNYLNKVIEFEQQQANTDRSQAAQDWKKQVLHLIGASDAQTGDLILPLMESYRKIIVDTLVGGEVHSYIKANNPNLTQSTAEVAGLINNGLSLLTYFGHSSSTSLDFNLNNPSDYTNSNGRYPVFIANGCNAGNFFAYDAARLNNGSYSISEKFVLAPSRGSIAFIASSSFGVLNTLDYITYNWYQAATRTNYGQSLGEIQQKTIQTTWNTYNGDYHTKLTLEETSINGDPAIKPFATLQPDYSIESQNIILSPSFISAADDSFHVRVIPYNLGKAVTDSITIKIERRVPNGTVAQTILKKLKGIRHTDTVEINLPIIGNLEKGTNSITVTIDPQNLLNEISKSNNTATTGFEISDDEIRPVYPYPLSVVVTPAFKLAGSTIDPLEAMRTYRMQMDTTELFNSPLLITKDSLSKGGVVEFLPMGNLQEGTVYYWRLAPVINGSPVNWRSASFLYNPGGTPGWNQSHLYQLQKSAFNQLTLDSVTRTYRFGNRINNLFITHSKYPESGSQDGHFSISVNGQLLIASATYPGNCVIFNVFDTVTFQPRKNPNGLYGSVVNNSIPTRAYNFQFSYLTAADRKKAIDFMDSIPVGYYVSARLILDAIPQSLADVWKADTALYGSGKSLYHYLQAQGAQLDSINDPAGRIWALVYRKNDATRFPSKFYYSPTIYDRITASVDCPTIDTLGYITSPKFGPAKQWQDVHWRGHTAESSNAPDSVLLSVIGVTNAGIETTLFTRSRSQPDFSIASVNAITYPYIKLRLRNQDSLHASPWQLDSWRINYTPVPEGAIAPNLFYTGSDSTTVDSLQLSKYPFSIAFKNVSNTAFDSVNVNVKLTDSLGNTRTIVVPKLKPLSAGDTAHINFDLSTDTLAGTYNMLVDINPDNSQLEQYHFNNFIYKSIAVVKPDNTGICPGSSITYKTGSTAVGSSYQWQVDMGAGFVNIANSAVYSGATAAELKLAAPPTSWYGYKFRAVITNGGNSFSPVYILKFVVKWNGSLNTAWENTANWSCGVLPDDFTDVVINSSINRYPLVSSNASCRSLKALPNSTIRVVTGYSLKVAGKAGN